MSAQGLGRNGMHPLRSLVRPLARLHTGLAILIIYKFINATSCAARLSRRDHQRESNSRNNSTPYCATREGLSGPLRAILFTTTPIRRPSLEEDTALHSEALKTRATSTVMEVVTRYPYFRELLRVQQHQALLSVLCVYRRELNVIDFNSISALRPAFQV